MRIYKVIIFIIVFATPFTLHAEDVQQPLQAVFVSSSSLSALQRITVPIPEGLGNEWDVTAIDRTLFFTATHGNIYAWSLDEKTFSTFPTYGKGFDNPIAYTACRKQNSTFIAVVPSYGNAHVLTFAPSGRLLNPGFFFASKPKSYRTITCVDINNDQNDELVIGERIGSALTITILNFIDGKPIQTFNINDWGPFDFELNRIDLGGDGIDEILIGSGGLRDPEIRIYRSDGSLINSLMAFPNEFKGGIYVQSGDLDYDGKEELIVGSGPGSGQLRVLDGFGNEKMTNKFFPLGANFRGGVIPLKVNDEIIALQSSRLIEDSSLSKSISINTTDQTLSVLAYGYLFASFPISTGTWDYPTPLGNHKVINKIPRAYSRRWGLFMPWWMAIVPSGTYGIHELPEWPNGTKEGEDHLGSRRSHGCIRVGVGVAKALYDWTPIGTPIIVK
ncbi:MAG: L,D-transpeptidase family protein [Patescibacteria group bacterium]